MSASEKGNKMNSFIIYITACLVFWVFMMACNRYDELVKLRNGSNMPQGIWEYVNETGEVLWVAPGTPDKPVYNHGTFYPSKLPETQIANRWRPSK